MPPPLAVFRTQTFRDIVVQSSYPGFPAKVSGMIDASQAKVADLEAQVAALEQERDRELMRISALKYAAAPVRKLPPEILVEIFIRSLRVAEETADPKDKYSAAKATLRTLYRLSSICDYWRQLIRQTRRLWTGPLHIIPCKDWTGHGQRPGLAFIEDLISRSAPQPLSLVLERTQYWDSGGDSRPWKGYYSWYPMAEPVLAAVVAVADRWRTLQSNFDPAHHYTAQQIPIFERLERIALDFGDKEAWSPNHESFVRSPFTTAPRLTDVALANVKLAGATIPWTQLTTLSLSYCDDEEQPLASLDAIAKCKSLVRLQLCVVPCRLEDVPDRSGDAETLLGVEEVRLAFTVYYDSVLEGTVHPFFERFAFPKLSLLEIGFTRPLPPPPALGTFLDSSPHIRHFALRSCKLDHLMLEDVFPRLSSATSLSFTDCSWTESAKLYQKLTYRHSDPAPPILPSLEELEISGSTQDDADLLPMLQSRWQSMDATLMDAPPRVARLQSMILRLPEEKQWEEWMLDDGVIGRLRSEGMALKVESRTKEQARSGTSELLD